MKRPRIYRSYLDYFMKRILAPLVLIVAAFTFASVYFLTHREAEMIRIRSTKIAGEVRSPHDALERAPE